LSLEETDAALTAVASAHVPLQIGFHYHHHPAYIRAREAIAAGAIGLPLVFKALQRDEGVPSPSFCDPSVSGGIIIDMGIHEFDLAQWLLNDDIVEVYTLASPPTDVHVMAVGDLDRALINLRFRSGAVGHVEVVRNSRYADEARHDILGSAGTILLGHPPQTNFLLASNEQKQGFVFPDYVEPVGEAYRAELAAFVRTVRTGELPSVNGACSRAALKVALTAYQSFRGGSPVEV
jgi:predicted dehydrogenase